MIRMLRLGFRLLWQLPRRTACFVAGVGLIAAIRLTADVLGDAGS